MRFLQLPAAEEHPLLLRVCATDQRGLDVSKAIGSNVGRHVWPNGHIPVEPTRRHRGIEQRIETSVLVEKLKVNR